MSGGSGWVVGCKRVRLTKLQKPASPLIPPHPPSRIPHPTSHIPPKPPTPMSNSEGWVHEQIHDAPLGPVVCACVCGWGKGA